MSEIEYKTPMIKCERCDHMWQPRGEMLADTTKEEGIFYAKTKADVRVCPSCKSPYWDKPKK